MAASAPYWSSGTLQTLVHRKDGPNALRLGQASMASDTRIPTSAARTTKAKICVEWWKNWSCNRNFRTCWACRSIPADALGSLTMGCLSVLCYLRKKPPEGSRFRRAPGAARCPGQVSSQFGPDTLLDVLHFRFDHLHDVGRQRDEAQLLSHLLAVVERPGEEVDHALLLGSVVAFFIRQHEGRRGDGPGVLGRLVEQVRRHATDLEVGTCSGVGDRILVRDDVVAGAVLQRDKG